MLQIDSNWSIQETTTATYILLILLGMFLRIFKTQIKESDAPANHHCHLKYAAAGRGFGFVFQGPWLCAAQKAGSE